MWAFKDHGKSFEAVYERKHPPGFRWLHESFGTNWRMLEIQAAIGRIQLKNMHQWTSLRTQNANSLEEALIPFSGSNGIVRISKFISEGCNGNDAGGCHAYYKYYTYLRRENLALGWSRDKIIEEVTKLGVPIYQGSCSEVYLEKAFDNTLFRPAHRLNTAKELGETSLMFLVHPTLKSEDIKATVVAIQKIFAKAQKN
jgi:dTDP-4-amino-4,6-dideoxygalactose transaminase